MDRFLARLYSRINYERQLPGGSRHFKLNNLRALLARIDNPELHSPVVHVAGTKGKGSVATMLANVLAKSGRKTGLFTSPHLVSINQRIAINGLPISNIDFEATLNKLQPEIDELDALCDRTRNDQVAIDGSSPASESIGQDSKSGLTLTGKPLTFFEVMTAAAMLYFKEQNCDAVVLEVGLGGRLDSTNVCQPSACVITNISMDHTRQLGDTIEKITAEKAGIVKPGVPVVSGVTQTAAIDVVTQVAAENDSDLMLVGRDFEVVHNAVQQPIAPATFAYHSGSADYRLDGLRLSMLGAHQRTNAALAVAAIQVLNCQGWNIDDQAVRDGLLNTNLPGRTQVMAEKPAVIFDVAHNVASMQVLLATLESELPVWRDATQKRLVLSISKDKDSQGILEVLLPHFDQVVLTRYEKNPRAIDPQRLLATAEKLVQQHSLGKIGLSVVQDPVKAFELARQQSSPTDLVCVTGSVFLVAELLDGFPTSAT